MTITSIDKGTVRMLLDEAEEALGHIAMKHGIVVSRKHCTYSQTEVPVAFKFVVPERTENGEAVDLKETEFKRLAYQFGFQPDDYGKVFRIYNGAYRLIALKPKGRKYRVLGESVSNGRLYKFSEQQVKDGLEKDEA